MSASKNEIFNDSVAIPFDWPKDKPYVHKKQSETMRDMEFVIQQATTLPSNETNYEHNKYKRYYEGFIANQINNLQKQIEKKKRQIEQIELEIFKWRQELLK